jgi:hypothetical protein
LAAKDLMDKIELGLVYYAHFRPHQTLGGATPAEIYFARTPAHLSAIPPPRGRPGEAPMDSPFRIEYADAEGVLPAPVQKQPERQSQRSPNSTESGRRVRPERKRTGEPLVSERQDGLQFPLHP